MELKDNPLIKPEDFMFDYRQNIEKLKDNPDLITFDKLCYELFVMNEVGKRFLEYVEERYLIPSLVNRDHANYAVKVIWADGFKDAYREIKRAIKSHDQRIKAEGRP